MLIGTVVQETSAILRDVLCRKWFTVVFMDWVSACLLFSSGMRRMAYLPCVTACNVCLVEYLYRCLLEALCTSRSQELTSPLAKIIFINFFPFLFFLKGGSQSS